MRMTVNHSEAARLAVHNLRHLRERYPDDPEAQHIEADRILCALLRSIDMAKVADAFDKIDRYYS